MSTILHCQRSFLAIEAPILGKTVILVHLDRDDRLEWVSEALISREWTRFAWVAAARQIGVSLRTVRAAGADTVAQSLTELSDVDTTDLCRRLAEILRPPAPQARPAGLIR